MTEWPPLIKVVPRKRWILWRDAIITVAAWAVFLFILVDRSILFWTGVSRFHAEHPGAFLQNWHFRLKPYALPILALLAWLLLFGWRSLRNWRRVTDEPPPLPIEAESARRRMPADDLSQVRSLKVATVSTDETGGCTGGPRNGGG